MEIFNNRITELLKPYGYIGNNICDARYFVEIKIADYWVDTPPKYRDEIAKSYAKKCSELKKIKKEITSFATQNNFKLIYDKITENYVIKYLVV